MSGRGRSTRYESWLVLRLPSMEHPASEHTAQTARIPVPGGVQTPFCTARCLSITLGPLTGTLGAAGSRRSLAPGIGQGTARRARRRACGVKAGREGRKLPRRAGTMFQCVLDIAEVRRLAVRNGWQESQHNTVSRVLGFTRRRERVNVYYTTGTVGTCVDHPRQGKTQLFRRGQTLGYLSAIFQDPRVHTGDGYYRKTASDGAEPELSRRAWWGVVDDVLLRDYDPEDTALLALGYGYFHIAADGSTSWGAGVPLEFENKLRGRQASLAGVDYVAFGDGVNDYYYVQFTDGSSQWSLPADLCSKLRNWPTHFTVGAVAFAPGDGWCVLFDDGSHFYSGLPANLASLISKWGGTGLEDVSIGPQGEWYVRFSDGTWECGNIPAGCAEGLSWIKRRYGVVNHVAFGHDSKWLITYEPG